MEVAAQALTLHRVEGITFCGIIFTNFSHEHLEFYPTLADYFYAKSLIFLSASEDAPLLINADDEHGKMLLAQHERAKSYGLQKTSKFLCPRARPELVEGFPGALEEILQQVQDERKKRIIFDYKAQLLSHPTQLIELTISHQDNRNNFTCPILFGAYNAYNVLAATSMALELNNMQPSVIQQALQTFAGVPGRLQEHVLPNGARCFIDYAHNPESFKAVLSTLRVLTQHLIVVFGAGGGRDKSKRPMMGNLAAEIADIIVVTSDNPRLENPAVIADDITSGISEISRHKIVQELDRKRAIELAYQLSDNGSIIALLGKGPDEYQIVGTTKHYFSECQIVEQL